MDKIPESFRGLSVGSKPEVIQNRFSGESVELDPIAVAMYDGMVSQVPPKSIYDFIRLIYPVGDWEGFGLPLLFFI